MKKLFVAVFAGAMLLSVPAFAQQTKESYDFSDIKEPFLKLPFEVTRVDTEGSDLAIRHVYHVTESVDKVVKKLSEMYKKGETFEQFVPMGLNKQDNKEYSLMFGYHNEHHFAAIRPDGAGCLIDVDAMPASFLSGRYDIAIYGYTMPDGSIVPVTKYNEE